MIAVNHPNDVVRRSAAAILTNDVGPLRQFTLCADSYNALAKLYDYGIHLGIEWILKQIVGMSVRKRTKAIKQIIDIVR